MDEDSPAVAELAADVAVAVSREITAVSGDVYEVILREIPELRDDKPVLTLLASSVHSNIGTCLQVMQHQIDLGAVRAPAAALEYARRLAQRGTSLPALLRSYRLPLGIRDTFDASAASTAGVDGGIHFAFGDAAKGTSGFRLTHRQALAAQAVALAAGSPPRAVAFSQVAPVAMMLGSAGLLRAWVLATLAGLAADDEHQARLRETLLAFLQTGGATRRPPNV